MAGVYLRILPKIVKRNLRHSTPRLNKIILAQKVYYILMFVIRGGHTGNRNILSHNISYATLQIKLNYLLGHQCTRILIKFNIRISEQSRISERVMFGILFFIKI